MLMKLLDVKKEKQENKIDVNKIICKIVDYIYFIKEYEIFVTMFYKYRKILFL